MSIDFRQLANSIANNGQFHLPPNDVLRQAEVIGYDPGVGNDGGYPTISLELAGDTNPVHGIRFADHYKPHLGDTVWVIVSGEDLWVLGKLADTKATSDAVRSHSSVSMVGYRIGDANQTVLAQTQLDNTAVTTPLLPNRLYKVEATAKFSLVPGTASPQDAFLGSWGNNVQTVTVTNSYGATLSDWVGLQIIGDGIPANTTITAAPNATTGSITISNPTTKTQTTVTGYVLVTHFVGLYVKVPDNSFSTEGNLYQELFQGAVFDTPSGAYTWSGSTLWYNSNQTTSSVPNTGYPYNWTGTYPNAQYTWYLAATPYSNGGSVPHAIFSDFSISIYDLGIAQ